MDWRSCASDKSFKSPRFHSLSRSSSIRSGSCSTVLKHSSVLSNRKVSAPSDPWWWRYLAFGVSDPSKSLRIGWIESRSEADWMHQIGVAKSRLLIISITIGPLELILYSSIVLMSTSKPQNMSAIGCFSSEISYDNAAISDEIHTTTRPSTPLISHRNQRICRPVNFKGT